VAYEAIGQLIAKLSSQPEMHAALRVEENGAVVGRFYEFDLASGFQSIVRLANKEIVGYDAYARSHGRDGDAISPWGLFSRAADDATVVQLDRLCRLVHTINYFSQPGANVPLYLRVHGRLLAAISQDHGKAFRRMIDALTIPASDIVLQLPTEATQDVLLVGIIIGNYQKSGFKVGVHANNVHDAQSLINLHSPQVVKLDARTIGDAERHIPALLATARSRGTQLVFTRIENARVADTLEGLGAEFGQGYLYDTPTARIAEPLSA
jgi:EAL domain-containing protein (putative c-di-GMP-specific phosphodiesterase class I)